MAAAERSRLTRSARPELAVILHGVLAGYVHQSANRKLVFRYDDAWRTKPGAFPLSLSMPLDAAEHGHQATSAFLWGLLPDDPNVIAYWTRLHGISRTDVVHLLAHVGEDCAGAVQLVPPDQVDRVVGASTASDEATSIEWLSTGDIAELLAALRRNPAAGRPARTQGQFSLAGAQPKTTLYHKDGEWGVPGGEPAVERITGDHWRAVARAVELPATVLLDRIVELGERVPAAIDRVIAHPDGDEATRGIVMRLMEPIAHHVTRCLKRL